MLLQNKKINLQMDFDLQTLDLYVNDGRPVLPINMLQQISKSCSVLFMTLLV